MFAVLNLGLKSIRLCLLDDRAHLRFKKAYPLHSVIFGEAVEQSGDEWWRLTTQLFADARTAGHDLRAVEALTVSASSSCLACVDQAGRLLRPIIMVNDRRHHQTESTGGPVLLQRLAWLARHEPATYAETARFLSPNDYLIYVMTGRAVTDPLNAEKFGYDAAQASYVGAADDLRARLPEVLPVAESVGNLRPEIASLLGLPRTTGVFLSSYDAIVSVVGSGALEPGDLCDVSGTVTSIRLVTTKREVHPTAAVVSQQMPLLGQTYLGGSTNLGGGLIEWLKTTFYTPAGAIYETMEAEAESVKASESSLIFLPYLLGERSPLWNPDARGVFFGLERTHGRRHFARATLESTAFIGLNVINEIVKVHGERPRRIRVSGGLSRLAAVNRIKADVYGLPLEVMAEFESTVLGAYLLAFHRRLAGGRPPLEWFREMVRVRDIILPDPEVAGAYAEKFRLFQDVYEALRPQFRRLRAMGTSTLKSEDGFLENL